MFIKKSIPYENNQKQGKKTQKEQWNHAKTYPILHIFLTLISTHKLQKDYNMLMGIELIEMFTTSGHRSVTWSITYIFISKIKIIFFGITQR